ncbi:MAG: amino acid ABC transporter substrate-binding protein [Chloroflexota bacterium]|nr:amino acid ABC transporter substrate-binding protein [Chloroflexota bacterium]
MVLRLPAYCGVLLGSLMLAACAGADLPLGHSAEAGGPPILFGATISITGPTAKEGEYTRDGYLLAMDTINRAGGIRVGDKHYRVALQYYDDGSDPARVPPLYQKLLTTDHVNFLLGPYTSALTAAAVPVAEAAQIPLLDAHGSAESLFSGTHYTFGILSPAANYLRGVIAVVHAKDPTAQTVALLGADEPFAHEVLTGAAAYARDSGLTVVYQAFYPLNPPDLTALLTAVKAQHPDILLGAGHLQDSLLITRQVHELRLAPKALGFTAGPSAPEFRANLKGEADYIFGATQWTDALQYRGDDFWGTPRAYAQAFKAQYPAYTEVPYQTAESSAALIVFQRAIEQAGSLDPAQVRAALAGLDLMTFYGRIKFDSRGVNIYKPMAVEQLQPDGHKYTVFPQDAAEKDSLYPMPTP